jgi:preprotein translocase subunit SecY
MRLGELITKVGVGYGVFLIVVSGIVARIPHAVTVIAGTENFWNTIVLLGAVWAITAVVITCMYKASRRAIGR